MYDKHRGISQACQGYARIAFTSVRACFTCEGYAPPALCLGTSLTVATLCPTVALLSRYAKSTLRKKSNFPNNCVRTYLRHDIGTHPPKPPSSACCTSHAHAPTRPPVHRTIPSTRHLPLTSQSTNTSPAHMQPGIHQSRPAPNVLRSSHYHHNQNTLTSQLKHPPHTCHPCLTNPTLPPTSLVLRIQVPS